MIMNELMEKVVASAETAVKLPESALRIMRLTDDPDANVSDIQSVIETDSALAARVLRVANSATYSRLRDVADIGTAVNLIGFREVSRIAVAVGALGGLSVLQNKLITISDYQRHSLICA
ncbi:MAG: HDOD domain-containing protein, partial [Gammaproteobacteria bacterium]